MHEMGGKRMLTYRCVCVRWEGKESVGGSDLCTRRHSDLSPYITLALDNLSPTSFGPRHETVDTHQRLDEIIF